jgi:hypothetical protein
MAAARVRQGVDRLDHAGQGSHLDDLMVNPIVHDANQVLSGEQNPRDAHGAMRFDLPFDGGLLSETTQIHETPWLP